MWRASDRTKHLKSHQHAGMFSASIGMLLNTAAILATRAIPRWTDYKRRSRSNRSSPCMVVFFQRVQWLEPLTLSLRAVTRKTTNRSATSEIITAFLPLRMNARKDFYQNAQYWKQIYYKTVKYTVWWGVCVHFVAWRYYRLQHGGG